VFRAIAERLPGERILYLGRHGEGALRDQVCVRR
jgi:hypothetical protein